jgi:hypothetical protein
MNVQRRRHVDESARHRFHARDDNGGKRAGGIDPHAPRRVFADCTVSAVFGHDRVGGDGSGMIAGSLLWGDCRSDCLRHRHNRQEAAGLPRGCHGMLPLEDRDWCLSGWRLAGFGLKGGGVRTIAKGFRCRNEGRLGR